MGIKIKTSFFILYFAQLALSLQKIFKMVKKFLFSILFLSMSFSTVWGQVNPNEEHWREPFDIYVGPKVGVTYSNFTRLDNDPMIWPMIGGFVEVFFTDRFGMNVEMNFTHNGAKNVYHPNAQEVSKKENVSTGPYEYRLDYINTEYKLKYYFTKPLCAFAGFHFGTLINAKSEIDGQSTNIRKQLHRQASVLMGASYETDKFVVEGLYCFPMRRLASKNTTADELFLNTKQNIFMLTFGYKIAIF